MANLMRSEEFQARTMIPEPFSHSGKIFQMDAKSIGLCAEQYRRGRRSQMNHLQFGAKVNRNQFPKKST
jgi:hypothetical protein